MNHLNLRLIAAIFSAGMFTVYLSAGEVTKGALKYEEPTSLTGTIYDKSGSNVLYKFTRTVTRAGMNLTVVREYTEPAGKLAARETVRYAGNQLESFALEELQTGEKGSATILRKGDSGKVAFSYQESGGGNEQATERLRPDTYTSDMIAIFVMEHWAELMRGQEIKCRYLVVQRKETIGFTLVKDCETSWRGKPAVVVRMEPSSWAVGLMTEPLYFTIEKDEPHRFFQYQGRTTPKMKARGNWKDLEAVTVFDWK